MKLSPLQAMSQQFKAIPPVVKKDLTGRTVIVTGANVGLGFEAAKHFASMNAGKVILACRDKTRGEAAVLKINNEVGRNNVELWILDLADFASVTAFADRFDKEGGRLDILVENAAIIPNLGGKFEPTTDGWEPSVKVNNLSTSLLALRLLPRMLQTAEQYKTSPRIVVVSSDMHYWTTLDRDIISKGNFFETFGKSKDYITPEKLNVRYQDTKLLNVFFARALNDKLKGKPIIVNAVNPGYCYSNLRTSFKGIRAVRDWVMEKIMAHTTEEGSRRLVFGAIGETDVPSDMRGGYLSYIKVVEPSDFIVDKKGQKIQDQLWDDLLVVLAKADSKVESIVKEHLS